MEFVDDIRRRIADVPEYMQEHKWVTAGVVIGIVLLIALAITSLVPGDGFFPNWLSPKLDIEGDDLLEVGQTIELKAISSLPSETYYYKWSLSNPDIGQIIGEGKEVTFKAKAPGETTITLEVDGRAVQKPLTVFTKSYLDIGLPATWLYIGNAYKYDLVYPTDSIEITDIYVENAQNQRMADGKFFQNAQDKKTLFIASDVDPGNYKLVVKGVTKSDGRTITTTTSFAALTELQRGYYKFSLADENLISIEPWHYSAIQTFLDNELKIDNIDLTNVKTQGKSVKVDSFRSQYVFYRDPSRADTICYETDVSVGGSPADAKNFYKQTTRSQDGTTYVVATDGIIFLVYPEGNAFNYYMQSQSSMGTVMDTNTGTTVNVPGTNTNTGNNNPTQGTTNIPSPPPPI